MLEIWILFYVITTGEFDETKSITSGTIEFGSQEACERAESGIRRTTSIDKIILKCLPSGRYVESPKAASNPSEADD
jgi:hypothetical protein